MKKVKAVLMAGGFGTRIMPLTTSIPKPMLPITNIPMMETIIQRLIEVGIDDIIILLYYKPEIIKNYFKDGKKWGIKINYVLPDDDYGTAGAVGCARDFLDTTFMVVSGDVVNDFDLESILKFHFEKKSKLTITLTRVDNPLQFGVVVTNKDNRIVKFLEKPSWGEVFSDTINTGLYVIEPEVLKEIPIKENFDFSKNLFPNLMKQDIPLWGFDAKGYWRDVGNPYSYLELHKDIFDGKLKWDFKKSQNDKIAKSVICDGVVSIDSDVKIDENTYIKDSTIGKNTKIGKNCNIQDCVIWDNVIIKDNSNLKDVIICNNVEINCNFNAEKGAVIAEKTKIGKNVSIDKNITIWAKKIIEDNSIISTNIVGDNKVKNTLFNQGKIVGVPNTEITSEMALKFAEAFGSTLPVGATVYVSRDYAKSSRMLKRLILGGLLSVGINVIDIEATPSNIVRYSLFKDDNISAAIHIRQSIHQEDNTEIMVFSSDAMLIGNNCSKDIEKIFFKENFRIVEFDKIGEIIKLNSFKKNYIKGLEANLSFASEHKKPSISIDLMYGMVSDIYPDILSIFNIDNVMINAYVNESKLTKISSTAKTNLNNLSKIVTAMKNDIGIALYPNAQKVEFVDNKGRIVPSHKMLMAIIYMMHLDDEKDYKVYLPAWAPEIFDEKFSDILINRGRIMDKDVKFLTSFDLLADTNGNYAFTNFGIHSDGIYTSLKIIEMLYILKRDLASIIEEIPAYAFEHIKINVPSSKKGTVMRKFLEKAEDRKVSNIDGVKIYISNSNWILAIPDDYYDIVHLYIQAKNDTKLQKIKNEFTQYIKSWIE